MVNTIHVSLEGLCSTHIRLPSTDILSLLPNGAFTTARTVNRFSILELGEHAKRTSKSLDTILKESARGGNIGNDVNSELSEGASGSSSIQNEIKPDLILSRMKRAAKSVITFLDQSADSPPPNSIGESVSTPVDPIEYRIVFYACVTKKTVTEALQKLAALQISPEFANCISTMLSSVPSTLLLAFASKLPQRVPGPVFGQLYPHVRATPSAKTTNWVLDRKQIERQRIMSSVDDIVLYDPKTDAILEGTQTNVFVLTNNGLQTAKENILNGTIRKLTIDVCQALNVTVIETPALVKDLVIPALRNCSAVGEREPIRIFGMIFTSTSRLFLPMDGIFVPAHTVRKAIMDAENAGENVHGLSWVQENALFVKFEKMNILTALQEKIAEYVAHRSVNIMN